ncbi:MAG TPA: HmuY family protein [Kofleriaceae bacterium]|nr:HmuY family protein [Kofleriaceae bacterium]
MMRMLPSGVVLLALMCACGGGDDDGSAGAADAGGDDGCDEGAALPDGWRPVDGLAGGTVTSTVDGDVVESLIDASAGGFGNSDSEPFLYVSFDDGLLLAQELTDVAAFDDGSWDLAFKRYVIRANGGDSGTGGVSVADVAADTLEEVTAPPADGAFGVDRWTDESCFPVGDGIGGPRTQFTDWYDITDMILTPKPLVYVVRRSGRGDWKLEIEDYYADEGDPEKSGVYRVRWAPLE